MNNQPHQPSEEEIQETATIINHLEKLQENGEEKEVDSAQPDNLTQHEVKDADGNVMTTITDKISGTIATPIEVRNDIGELLAQSQDDGGWSIGRYIENGADVTFSN